MTNDTPTVSILIAAYNVTAYIAETLDSVFAQTFQDFEVIVVNDGCPDTANLERVLEPYLPRINYFKQENGGPSAARNTAIRAAKAPLVSLLDGDDAWMPDYLEYQLAFLRSHPDVDLVYPNMVCVGGGLDGVLVMDRSTSEGEPTFLALLLQRCTVLNGVTMRREIVFRAGLWDPEMRYAEDFDLWVRIARLGCLAYHRKPLVRRRILPGSLSAVPGNMLRGQMRIYSKVEPLLELEASDRERVREKARSVQAELDLELGWTAIRAGNRQAAIMNWRAALAACPRTKLAVAVWCLRWLPGPALAMLRRQAAKRPGFQPGP